MVFIESDEGRLMPWGNLSGDPLVIEVVNWATQLNLQADEARIKCRSFSGFTGLENDKFANDRHWQEEMSRVVEKCYEPELFVELASRIADGIDFDPANAKLSCKVLRSSQRVD